MIEHLERLHDRLLQNGLNADAGAVEWALNIISRYERLLKLFNSFAGNVGMIVTSQYREKGGGNGTN